MPVPERRRSKLDHLMRAVQVSYYQHDTDSYSHEKQGCTHIWIHAADNLVYRQKRCKKVVCKYDIKPYLAFTDSHPEAKGGFADRKLDYSLEVNFPENLLCVLPEEKRKTLCDILSQDPRPAYIEDSERIYGLSFAGFEIKFSVCDNTLFVKEVEKRM
jgi:hypothetical protein